MSPPPTATGTPISAGISAVASAGLAPPRAQRDLRPRSTRPLRGRFASRLALIALLVLSPGCSIRSLATRALADSFAGSGTGFASDDDPELIRDAAPFALKTMEQLLPSQPRHLGLLAALASGFTSYGYAFVQVEADELADKDVQRARPLQARARRLFLRARDYGLQGLEVGHPGLASALRGGRPEDQARAAAALASARRDEVPLLYWTAAAWALAVSASRDDMRMVAQLPSVEALMARAAALDPDYDQGSIDEFYISYEGGKDGGVEAARRRLLRVRALAHGDKLGALVSFAEAVDVSTQNRKEFRTLLEEAIAFDVDRAPERRLANIVAQRRARWLLARIEELFAE